jgi:hypothetical protein
MPTCNWLDLQTLGISTDDYDAQKSPRSLLWWSHEVSTGQPTGFAASKFWSLICMSLMLPRLSESGPAIDRLL